MSGTPTASVLDQVLAAVSSDTVRPLTDHVIVAPADIVNYTVEAALEIYPGPDAALVEAAAEASIAAYTLKQRRIGLPVTRSGLFAALHQPGVRNVTLTHPAADIVPSTRQAAICTGISVSRQGSV